MAWNRRARTQVHIVRYGLDRDLSRRRAESLLLYLGAGALTMRVPVGALADRCGRSRVYSAVCLTERHRPRSTQAGPRDTPEDHVLEVTYDPIADAEQWRRRELDEDGKRVLLKDD